MGDVALATAPQFARSDGDEEGTDRHVLRL